MVEAVRQVWREVLRRDGDLPADVNFFELGGDSRTLVVLFERLSLLTERPLIAADLFSHSTVRAQARLLSSLGQDGA
jgi:hypothetical protein